MPHTMRTPFDPQEAFRTLQQAGVKPGTIMLRANNCPRCKQHHGQMPFSEFTKPLVVGDREFTHYATCPAAQEPILVKVTHDIT